MTNEWDAVIIGGGVAGLSAAQMLGRSRRRTLVIDAGEPRNRFSAHMHGVLGQDGTPPEELLAAGRVEAAGYGVEFSSGRVRSIREDGARLRVIRDDDTVDSARVIVIATGVRDELPAIPGLADAWGDSVLHCPYCHGWEVAGGRLGVLATSPASIHQIELVRQLSDDVTAFTAAVEPLDEETTVRLLARGIRIVPDAVEGVRRTAHGLTLRTQDGAAVDLDALFTAGEPNLGLHFAEGLRLAREDAPGSPLRVDVRGATSHARVFAAGNAVAPFANVPVAMGTGSMAGAGANAALAAEDVDIAVATRSAERSAAWDARYRAEERIWSGDVNATVADIVAPLAPGSALDVGSGEGGDALWLAERGWRVTAVDISPTAVRRTADVARERRVDLDVRVGDGAASVGAAFDLVLASFLHSWEPDFPRIRMLREASDRVAAGGHLLIVSHAAPPPWSPESHGHGPGFRGPHEELALLDLDRDEWVTEICETRRRPATAPDGTPSHLDDGVLLLRRLREPGR